MPLRLDEASPIARRYGFAAEKEWQRVRAHFALGEGFALLVLIVPDPDGARLCRTEVEAALSGVNQRLWSLPINDPPDLPRETARLPDQVPEPDIGGLWIEAVVPLSSPAFPAWEAAWRAALEGLNQQRNPLREAFQCPVMIVAAPWAVPLFRDVAPDLWSVRSQVVRIEPDPAHDRDRSAKTRQRYIREEERPPADAPDPDFALKEAERLRGAPDRVRDRVSLLLRAGWGLIDRHMVNEAEAALGEAADLSAVLNDVSLFGVSLHGLGLVIRNQGRAAEAETMFRRALALLEEGGVTAKWRGSTADMLGRTILDQGRAAEAETMFRRALTLKEEGATATSRGLTVDMLGRAILDQGRAAEAETMFRRALALAEEGGDTATSRGITADNLGRAILDQGRAAEAETMFRHALTLLEEGGATATSRGLSANNLGSAILDQGRAAEAEAMFRHALVLKEEGSDTATSRGITAAMLGRAILDQGRAAEAEAMFRRALALAEEGNASADLIDRIRHDLVLSSNP